MSTNGLCCFVHSDEIDRYRYPPDSPFKTQRAGRTRELLRSMGYFEGENRRGIQPQRLTDEELALFHTPEYIQALKDVSAGDLRPEHVAMGLGIGDCPVFPDLFPYASLASGGTVAGARLILDGIAHTVFNPSGGFHHAKAAEAGGFCYINDIVLACTVLANAGKRVFCLDLDAHHGNGTQEAFYSSSAVFTVSFHESGNTLYPWGGFENEVGEGSGRGFNVNLPLPAGTDDDVYVSAFNEVVPPLIYAFSPDVIVLELGMDVLSVDPLVHLKMSNNAFADILPRIMQFNTPILATGGGGYEFEATARSWALMWTILAGIQTDADDMVVGMGGVFLGSSEWAAGLRDRRIYTSGEQRKHVINEVERSIEIVKHTIFPMHGM